MKKNLYISLFLILLLSSCNRISLFNYKFSWENSPDGVWAGPDFWANRLQDWKVADGRLVCTSSKPMRTVHLTTRAISGKKGFLNISVSVFRTSENTEPDDGAAGILVGAGNGMNHLSASLVFHSWGKSAGLFVGLDSKGNLFVRDFEKENDYLKYNRENDSEWTEAHIIVKATPYENNYKITVLAVNPFTNFLIDKLELEGIKPERLQGNIALVSHPGYGIASGPAFAFSDLKVRGTKILKIPSGNIGPVISCQYTLSMNILKLTAQLMPVNDPAIPEVVLQVNENGDWKSIATAQVKKPSYTARFRIENWNSKTDIEYRVSYSSYRNGRNPYYLYGTIKHDPVDKEEIKMLSLSCFQQIARSEKDNWSGIDGGHFTYDQAVLFPHAILAENLRKQNADILFFAGDQVYEGSSPTAPDLESPYLDYLYKWYLWCLCFRDLTAAIPAITIPDDHDVYHGNLWGEGGKPAPAGLSGAAAQDAGGYKMPADFVNMVQETQTSHLPDPFDPVPAEQGINVYFTECKTGGISLAVLEDRKFKSAPKALLPDADISNGWPRNRYWNAKYNSELEDATLLGERQLSFLKYWSEDWTGKTWMKAVLSQTLFANLATIPGDSTNDEAVPLMEIPDSGGYVDGDRLATDFDSDGWPQPERNKAINLFRKAFAVHAAGDQHLGSTVQYGIDDFRDANFAIVSPASGNIWPRHWFPPVEGRNRKEGWPKNLGDFEDGFGNKMTVYAVANPHASSIVPASHSELSPGYSSITFFRSSRDIELSNWSYYADPDTEGPFPFWPVRINQMDNYLRTPAGWLPEIRVEGLTDPVIRVIREYTGELAYSLRINGNSFQPRIFEIGFYTVEVGEPDQDRWQKLEKIWPTEFKQREPLTVKF